MGRGDSIAFLKENQHFFQNLVVKHMQFVELNECVKDVCHSNNVDGGRALGDQWRS